MRIVQDVSCISDGIELLVKGDCRNRSIFHAHPDRDLHLFIAVYIVADRPSCASQWLPTVSSTASASVVSPPSSPMKIFARVKVDET